MPETPYTRYEYPEEDEAPWHRKGETIDGHTLQWDGRNDVLEQQEIEITDEVATWSDLPAPDGSAQTKHGQHRTIRVRDPPLIVRDMGTRWQIIGGIGGPGQRLPSMYTEGIDARDGTLDTLTAGTATIDTLNSTSVDSDSVSTTTLSGLSTDSIQSLTGDNLSVVNNSLTASTGTDTISHVSVHDIDDFGADPTGTDPSDIALDDAIAAADPGDWVVMTNGTYYFGEQHLIEKPIELVGTGSRIESDYHDELAYPDDQDEHYYPLFKFAGTLGSTSGLTSAAERGADMVTVTNPDMFAVGDGIIIRNENTSAEVMSRSYRPTVAMVRAIDGDDIYLHTDLKYDVGSGWYATQFDPIHQPVVRDLNVYPRTEPTFDSDAGKVLGGPRHVIATRLSVDARVENVYATGYDSHVWTTSDCLNATGVGITAEDPMNYSGSCGEPLYFNGSSDITLVNPTLRGCRRGPDIRSGCKTLTVINPDITGVTLNCLSHHGGEVAGKMHTIGGHVKARSPDATLDDHGGTADRRWELQRGRLLSAGDDAEYEIEGTDFVVNYSADINGSVFIENSEITVPEGADTTVGPMVAGNGTLSIDRVTITAGTNRDAITGNDVTNAVRLRLGDITADTPIDVSNTAYSDVWLGAVQAPSISTHVDSTVHNAYGV